MTASRNVSRPSCFGKGTVRALASVWFLGVFWTRFGFNSHELSSAIATTGSAWSAEHGLSFHRERPGLTRCTVPTPAVRRPIASAELVRPAELHQFPNPLGAKSVSGHRWLEPVANRAWGIFSMQGHLRIRGKRSWAIVLDLGRDAEPLNQNRLWRPFETILDKREKREQEDA